MRKSIAVALALPAALVAFPAAADPPGSPVGLSIYQRWDTSATLLWRNTHPRREESLGYYVDQTVNGSAPTRRYLGMSGPRGLDDVSEGVDQLTPETDYCFRVWVRSSSGTFSANPTNWACTRTQPSAPLQPLNVRAHRRRTLDSVSSPAIVEWSTPDQSAHRPIVRFEVERQSPRAANTPWVMEHSIAAANGQQMTQPTFRVSSSRLPAKGEHAFRVCAVNERARNCAAPVVTVWTEIGPQELAAQAPQFQPHPERGIDTLPRVAPRKADAAPPAASTAVPVTATNAATSSSAASSSASTMTVPPNSSRSGANAALTSDPEKWAKSAPALSPAAAPASTLGNSRVGDPAPVQKSKQAPSAFGERQP